MRRGRKARHWDAIRKTIKAEFERDGITSCEVCGSTFALSFAHRLKRRFITDDSELRRVALLCQKHHDELEYSGHENMYQRITEIIQARVSRCT